MVKLSMYMNGKDERTADMDGEKILEVMRERHSVRQYTEAVIPQDIRERLSEEVGKLNEESGLSMQLFFDEPECFERGMARYGQFGGVRNYLALVGKKGPDLEEKCGYYGELVVILAQSLGLNSCWVGLTHGKSHAVVEPGQKQVIVVALGYGKTQGGAHKSKPESELCSVTGPTPVPEWFERGMEAAMLAPTAMNQQKFIICWDGLHLTARVKGAGFFTKTDLGIVKCDFELASGHSFDA